MKFGTLTTPLIFALILWAAPALGQHCGGSCEVMRPAAPPVSLNPKFQLVAGKEKKNWAYLHNFIWTENGNHKHPLMETLASPPLVAFGYRRIFVSPAGNGFLVTGNPYVESHPRYGTGRMAQKTPLFIFCNEQGKTLTQIDLVKALKPAEVATGDCPENCGCKDILYVYEKDPAVSQNGLYVNLVTKKTKRTISFCLPFGSLIENRKSFENRLAELEWEQQPENQRDMLKNQIAGLITELESPNGQTRDATEKSLIEKGFLALPQVRLVLNKTNSPEIISRLQRIESQLQPWTAEGYESLSKNLVFLKGLLSFNEERVVNAVENRLRQLIPTANTTDWETWLDKHLGKLQWDDKRDRYEIQN